MNTPYQEALGASLIDRTIREKIVLVSVALPGVTEEAVDASLDELELLVDTAGADVAARVVQRRSAPDHTWYIGKGKVEELAAMCKELGAYPEKCTCPGYTDTMDKTPGAMTWDELLAYMDDVSSNGHAAIKDWMAGAR